MERPLRTCSRFPTKYWPKWWRAQAAAFLLRPNAATEAELAAFRKAHLVGAGPAALGCYVRHGHVGI